MSIQTQHQGGWIASFLIVGAVLVFGLVGTVYFLKTKMSDDVQIASELQTDDSERTIPPPKESDAVKEKSPKKDDSEQKSDTSDDVDHDITLPSEPEVASDAESDETADELPTTGPGETAISLFVLALVAYSVTSYLRSRRQES
jgi:hypothetical protein